MCRTERLGSHVFACHTCGKLKWVPNACKSRFCTSCGTALTDKWIGKTLSFKLNVPHHHVTFTLPSQLRALIAANKRELLNALFQSSTQAILSFYKRKTKRKPGIVPGIIAVLQTFGRDLHFHPHIHMLVTRGGITRDGLEWVDDLYIPIHVISKRFVANFVKRVRKLYQAGKLVIPPDYRFPDLASLNDFLDEIAGYAFVPNQKKSWCVYLSPRQDEDTPAPLTYIARYLKRPPISEARISFVTQKDVGFYVQEKGRGRFHQTLIRLPALVFMERLLQHVPLKRFNLVRFGGIYSSYQRSRLYEKAWNIVDGKIQEKSPILATTTPYREEDYTYAKRWERKTGKNPLKCGDCGNEMQWYEKLSGGHPIMRKYTFAGLRKLNLLQLIKLLEDTS